MTCVISSIKNITTIVFSFSFSLPFCQAKLLNRPWSENWTLSLWNQWLLSFVRPLIGDIIGFITAAAYNYLPYLLIFSWINVNNCAVKCQTSMKSRPHMSPHSSWHIETVVLWFKTQRYSGWYLISKRSEIIHTGGAEKNDFMGGNFCLITLKTIAI